MLLRFKKQSLRNTIDPYKRTVYNEKFNSFVLNDMFNQQEAYESKKQLGFQNFLLNKLDDVDVEYNYETADENKLFKTASPLIVDLESYTTEVSADGINLKIHLKNKMNYRI